MYGHDIIVIGASAGGVEALSQLVRDLPEDLPAAVFVVLHIPPRTPSLMPDILSRKGPLPAAHAADGEPIVHGRIYLAPPDKHLLIKRDYVHVVRGPKENRHRPAVDPLFRSAALAYGPRVVGVILTGALDDGTAGMKTIKTRGGVAIVQDPVDALYRSMPQSALLNVRIDHCLPLSEIAPRLVRLAREQAAEEGAYPVPEDLEIEARIAEQEMNSEGLVESAERLGVRSTFTCPECHGMLWEQRDAELLRFRCHVGHAYSIESLLDDHEEKLDGAMWSALRALEEKVMLMRRMAGRAREQNLEKSAIRFEERAREADEHAGVIRQLLLSKQSEATEVLVEEQG